jgi:predicted nuclease of predicted toxin-antitoxin system
LSKRSSITPRNRRLFLIDENLGSEKLPELLRQAGYKVVTHKSKYGGAQGIPDSQIIADCGREKLILLTADSRLETLWAAEIQQAGIAVVILSNNIDGASAWGARLSIGKKDILAKLRAYKEPCALRFGKGGRVTHVRLYGPKRARLIAI